MKKHLFIVVSIVFLILTVSIVSIMPSILNHRDLQIAYVANLSGPNSLQGNGGLNGALMAIKEYKLTSKSVAITAVDMASFEDDDALFDKLDTLKPDLILGPASSTEYLRLKPYITTRETPCLGVAVSLDQESDIKDSFFRLVTSTSYTASKSAGYAANQLNFKRTFILYDQENIAYSKSYANAFKAAMPSNHDCQEKNIPDFSLTPEVILGSDSILIVAPPQLAGLSIQKIRAVSKEIPILMSAWSLSPITHQYAGGFDNDLYFLSIYSINQNIAYQDFSNRYQATYSEPCNIVASIAFESVALLDSLIKKENFKSEDLKTLLQQEQEIHGPFGHYTLNGFGDILRPIYLLKYDNGIYIEVAN